MASDETRSISLPPRRRKLHIRSFRLAVPGKPFGLTLILRFSDRCGKPRPAASAPGGAGLAFRLPFQSKPASLGFGLGTRCFLPCRPHIPTPARPAIDALFLLQADVTCSHGATAGFFTLLSDSLSKVKRSGVQILRLCCASLYDRQWILCAARLPRVS